MAEKIKMAVAKHDAGIQRRIAWRNLKMGDVVMLPHM
jgi:hypothetical protein